MLFRYIKDETEYQFTLTYYFKDNRDGLINIKKAISKEDAIQQIIENDKDITLENFYSVYEYLEMKEI